MAMLLAVLEARCGLNFSSAEVYLNVAGGYRLADPAADLAVAAALISALGDKPLPKNAVWFGEVSLAGEIRPVSHSSIRQRESAKLGFGRAIGPAGGTNGEGSPKGIQFTGLTMLPNLVDRILTDA
jgi:DNA repair protein RadA/Sms